MFFQDAGKELQSLPASWTSAAADDPYVVISAGRSPFRVVDLLRLAELVAAAGESAEPPKDARIV